jgi:hypothetical protein
MKPKVSFIFIVLIFNIYSCVKDENICAYPCDVVFYQSGIGIRDEDCMGEFLDVDAEFDTSGRLVRSENIYENVTIDIENIKYNTLSQVTSFNATTTWRNRSVETTFTLKYSVDHQLIDVICK